MKNHFLDKLRSQPVFRIQILSFLIIAIVPILFLSINIYRLSWEDEWREIREKHQLLAENLSSPIYNYVMQFRDSLAILANSATNDGMDEKSLLDLTSKFQKGFSGLQTITLIDSSGNTRFIVDEDGSHIPSDKHTAHGVEKCYQKTMETKKYVISGISESPTNKKPVIIITQPIFEKPGIVSAVLMGELKIDEIERLRKSIHFGVKGHSAIVDARGNVIAHPNPDWMVEMRDLSHLSVIKLMMAGKTGVTEFYSPFVKKDMVAGYTAVPEIGWGVMVPQPKSEVIEHVDEVMLSHLYWILAGIVLSTAIALFLVRWITEPINLISDASRKLSNNAYEGNLPEIPRHAPREIRQLGEALHDLVTGLQQAKNEVQKLNESLLLKVDAATSGLRVANNELKKLAAVDHLTSLANRRSFETFLAESLRSRQSEDVCVLLIDIDKFKEINDSLGHAAGDSILVQMSALLNQSMREDDLLARYGGDEIAIQLNCSANTAKERAEDIRSTVEKHVFEWDGNEIKMTVSIGLLLCDTDEVENIEMLLKKVDEALYEAKGAGRNTIRIHK